MTMRCPRCQKIIDEDRFVTLRRASEILGVNFATMRSWKHRYGALEPSYGRLYDMVEVKAWLYRHDLTCIL